MLDICCRYLWLYALEEKSANNVAQCLQQLFHVFGTAKVLLTDNGTEFKGAVKDLSSKIGVQMRHGRPEHPQTTGKVM